MNAREYNQIELFITLKQLCRHNNICIDSKNAFEFVIDHKNVEFGAIWIQKRRNVK